MKRPKLEYTVFERSYACDGEYYNTEAFTGSLRQVQRYAGNNYCPDGSYTTSIGISYDCVEEFDIYFKSKNWSEEYKKQLLFYLISCVEKKIEDYKQDLTVDVGDKEDTNEIMAALFLVIKECC